ncbi:MAG TPA: MarR family transcriptional regulator [Solirubrobacteraceae bacterium]|nr:MarR family transcriptional regulator [Solirubrobacteraceae bacterium]
MGNGRRRAAERDLNGVPISYALTRLSRAVGHHLTAARLTLSGPQAIVLIALRQESGLSNAELARRALVSPQSMHEVIAELERMDLIERRPDPDNRRILRAELTGAGRDLLTGWDLAIDDVEDRLFDGFSPDEVKAFAGALERCVANMGLDSRR